MRLVSNHLPVYEGYSQKFGIGTHFDDEEPDFRYSDKEIADTIGEELWDRFNAGVSSIKWYYTTLGDIFKKIEITGLCDWKMTFDLYKEYESLLDSIFMNT